MKAIIQNFLGCELAEINLDHVTLIAGKMAMGKSSIIRGIALASTGLSVPPGALKKAAASMVRDGAKKGVAVIQTADGGREIEWPAGTVSGFGGAPPGGGLDFDAHSCGLVNFVWLNAAERSRLLTAMLRTAPEDRLVEALIEEDVSRETSEKIHAAVVEDGWEAAHDRAKQQGAKLKGRWEEVTGDRYGSAKADKWMPPDWDPNADRPAVATLEVAVADAKQALENAIAAEGATDAERDVLRRKAESADGLKQELARLKGDYDAALAAHQTAQDVVTDTIAPASDTDPDLECPKCGEDIIVNMIDGQPKAVKRERKYTKTQLAKMLAKREAAKAKAMVAAKKCDAIKADGTTKRAAYDDAMRATEALKAATATGSRDAVDVARASLSECETAYFTAAQFDKATQIHAAVTANTPIVDALAPKGVRAKAAGEAIVAVNEELAEASDWLNLDATVIGEDFAVTMGDRLYDWCSASEKWRVRFAIQLSLAVLAKAPFILVDEAEHIEPAERGNVIRAVVEAKMPAVIAMTVSRPKGLPDLGTTGHGETVWAEDGILIDLEEAVSEAAA